MTKNLVHGDKADQALIAEVSNASLAKDKFIFAIGQQTAILRWREKGSEDFILTCSVQALLKEMLGSASVNLGILPEGLRYVSADKTQFLFERKPSRYTFRLKVDSPIPKRYRVWLPWVVTLVTLTGDNTKTPTISTVRHWFANDPVYGPASVLRNCCLPIPGYFGELDNTEMSEGLHLLWYEASLLNGTIDLNEEQLREFVATIPDGVLSFLNLDRDELLDTSSLSVLDQLCQLLGDWEKHMDSMSVLETQWQDAGLNVGDILAKDSAADVKTLEKTIKAAKGAKSLQKYLQPYMERAVESDRRAVAGLQRPMGLVAVGADA